jgi:predicted amidohydrolase YtcJ
MNADLLFVNGKIFSDPAGAPYDFLAIQKDRVLSIGRGSSKHLHGPKTQIVDLKGMAVTPGLIDSHIHFLDYALNLNRINLEQCGSVEQVRILLKERAGHAAPGEWILGRGWTQTQFGGFPHKSLLDEIFPDNPVVLESRDGHVRWVNSFALKAAGLERPRQIEGGFVGTDPDGSSSGIVGENAIALMRTVVPQPDASDRKRALLRAQNQLHRYGITGLHGFDAEFAFEDLQDLHAESKLQLRVFQSIPIRFLEHAVKLSLRSGMGDSWLKFGVVKIFSDGTLGAQTAWMLEPFSGTNSVGLPTIPENELIEKVKFALENGIAVAVHAIGDRANRDVLNSFEKNSQLLKIPRASSRIEHVQLLREDDLSRFHQLGIVASMQPFHAVSDYELAEKYWGERNAFSYPWRSLLNTGATLIFGSDAPVEDPDPLLGLQAAVHRERWSDKRQTISPAQALLAYTFNPAYASGEQDLRGSLQEGKLADLTIFSDDPIAAKFQDVKVSATVVNGIFVYHDFQV